MGGTLERTGYAFGVLMLVRSPSGPDSQAVPLLRYVPTPCAPGDRTLIPGSTQEQLIF
jgi:hypothetical protein